MKNINQTKTISELLNTFTFGDLSKGKSFSDTIKHSTIFSFWEDIIGKKLAKYTKPIKIKYSKLYVSAKSPAIIQELNLLKQKILLKVNTYSAALGFKIKDIVFDYKNYSENIEPEIHPGNMIEYFYEDDLSKYSVSEDYEDEVKKNISKINFLDNEQKNRLIQKILNVKKAHLKRLHELDKK